MEIYKNFGEDVRLEMIGNSEESLDLLNYENRRKIIDTLIM